MVVVAVQQVARTNKGGVPGMSDPIVTTDWHTPTLEAFRAANPHMLNHSSRLVLDPEVDVSVNPPVDTSGNSQN